METVVSIPMSFLRQTKRWAEKLKEFDAHITPLLNGVGSGLFWNHSKSKLCCNLSQMIQILGQRGFPFIQMNFFSNLKINQKFSISM